ncbi:MAG: PAS domain-containing protein [Sphingomonas sp.]
MPDVPPHEIEPLPVGEDEFRLIADSAPVAVWVTRLDRRRSFVNRAYTTFLGVSYQEALDFDWRTIIHPADAARVLAESIAGEASLATFELDGRYRRKDGAWRWLHSTSQPRRDAEGAAHRLHRRRARYHRGQGSRALATRARGAALRVHQPGDRRIRPGRSRRPVHPGQRPLLRDHRVESRGSARAHDAIDHASRRSGAQPRHVRARGEGRHALHAR